MKKHRIMNVLLAILSIWVPLVGLFLWYMNKKYQELVLARIYLICGAVGLALNMYLQAILH